MEARGELFESATGDGCRPVFAVDGTRRCLPDGGTTLDEDDAVFGDDACTERLAPLGRGDLSCGQASYAATYDTTTCGQDTLTGVFALGLQHGGAVYQLELAGLDQLGEELLRVQALLALRRHISGAPVAA